MATVTRLKAYFLEFKTQLELPPNTERKTEFFFGGSYDCDIRRVDGKWKMKRRTVFIDHLS
jgi:hypothetical protein